MFDKVKFKAAAILAGKTYIELAEALQIDVSTLYRKINGISDFTRAEIQTLCDVMNLDSPVDIFFSKDIA